MPGSFHGESPVHYTQVELHRLGEADTQPERDQCGERAGDTTLYHVSNISVREKVRRVTPRKTFDARQSALGRGRRFCSGDGAECGDQRQLGFGYPFH